jgi:exodeoxyribonuclease III
VRIATYNINGVNGRLETLLGWLDATAPDVACLQELKAPDARFPAEAIRAAGYGAVWHGEPRWNGVAILARGAEPVETRRGLPGEGAGAAARYIEAAVGGVIVGNLYLPNGNPRPGPRFDGKMEWIGRFLHHAETLAASGLPAVLAGDYNIIPTPRDVYRPERWTEDALFAPEVRDAFARLLAQGWTDALRHLHPEETIYTFWDYLRHAWERDAGLRLDHLLVSPALLPQLKGGGIDRSMRGAPHASDHAPAWIELAAAAGATARRKR